jgi:hypothetical protein
MLGNERLDVQEGTEGQRHRENRARAELSNTDQHRPLCFASGKTDWKHAPWVHEDRPDQVHSSYAGQSPSPRRRSMVMPWAWVTYRRNAPEHEQVK